MTEFLISRRALLRSSAFAATAVVTGCATTEPKPGDKVIERVNGGGRFRIPTFGQREGADAKPSTKANERQSVDLPDENYALMYGAMSDGGFNLPAVPWEKINPRYLRQTVANTTGEGAGKLVVVTSQHALYWTLPFGRAVRYGVGLGREGFEWSGRGNVKRKTQWPRWHPPEEMIERQPELEKYRTTYNKKTKTWDGGMGPGLFNPLGARALYIFQGEVDTQYRLHGSPEWNSIGKSVSSGCVRLMNQDVIDLYKRVPEGTEVIVR